MRTIELTEHQSTQYRLTRTEVDQLLATRLVSLAPLPGENWWEVRAGSRVGTVILESLRILIRPKVPLENLFFLLGFGAGLTRWSEEVFPYEQEPDLLRAVAWVFEAEVRRASAQGLVRGYQAREMTLSTVRGRINSAAQLRIRQSQPFPLECRFEEFTEDIELNRVVKAAHRRLLQVPGLDIDLARCLGFRYRSFDDVTPVEYSPGFVPDLAFTRLDRHWETAGRLSELILRQQTLRDQVGAVIGIAFTVDMNKLFEQFVEVIVREEAQKAGWQLLPQARRHLTEEVRMRPDLVLRFSGRDYAVADAKYKELELKEWPHADLYQLLVYCVALGLPAGLLIYAGTREDQEHTVNGSKTRLAVVGVDLSGTARELEARMRTVARRLIDQADKERMRLTSVTLD